jgi:hypothetical protein
MEELLSSPRRALKTRGVPWDLQTPSASILDKILSGFFKLSWFNFFKTSQNIVIFVVEF